MSEPPCIDEKILANLRQTVGDLAVQRFIDLFLDNCSKKMEAAIAGEEKKDYKAVAGAVHSLISSTGTLGAVHLQKLAEQIQYSISQKKNEEVSRLLPELIEAFDKVKLELDRRRIP